MAIVRRTKTTSEYVYRLNDGHLIIQPPRSASHWPHDFKLRISQQWLAPKDIKTIVDFETTYIATGWQNREYLIEGRPLQIRNLIMPTPYGSKLIVTKTIVVDSLDNSAIDLIHPNFLMRIMFVYCFAKRERIGGVPELPIYPLSVE